MGRVQLCPQSVAGLVSWVLRWSSRFSCRLGLLTARTTLAMRGQGVGLQQQQCEHGTKPVAVPRSLGSASLHAPNPPSLTLLGLRWTASTVRSTQENQHFIKSQIRKVNCLLEEGSSYPGSLPCLREVSGFKKNPHLNLSLKWYWSMLFYRYCLFYKILTFQILLKMYFDYWKFLYKL